MQTDLFETPHLLPANVQGVLASFEFRNNNPADKYIAIKIKVADLHEWKDGQYPHKIAFREGKVMYQCDRFGKEIK